MLRQIATPALLAAALMLGSASGALAEHCGGEAVARYEPSPVYVYDHSTGPTWTGNGWAYLPIGSYRPRPGEGPPPAHAHPPRPPCSQSVLVPILEPVMPPVLMPILVPVLPW
jgi:hypothetical protein